ncbi:MAG: hypothetical protein H0V35_00780 [Nitrospira sp.]|nr:hypothetical protein [Nitrospira sp.]
MVRAEENQKSDREKANDFLALRTLLRQYPPSTTASLQGGRFIFFPHLPLSLWILAWVFSGCGLSSNHYSLIDQSLLANDPRRADAIMAQAESQYGSRNRLLYNMDRGMTLHLAGDYVQSNSQLENAAQDVERLYTRSVRTETAAFLTSDNLLPYEGDAYEHVMINVIKALNYAAMGQTMEAVVEARQIDHRLNVLSDRVREKDGYREDAFARYLTGVLYEATGDLNNAFIAYRHAYDIYKATLSWARTPLPSMLPADLLRTTDALHMTGEFDEYRRLFPEARWVSTLEHPDLAQVVVISYNGRAPRKGDNYLDLPLSLSALQLVLLNRGVVHSSNRQERRAADSILYGLNGRVVRVALPRLIPQKTQVMHEDVTLIPRMGEAIAGKFELVYNGTAMAEKSLSDRLPGITTKALARAALKFAAAEGATRGAQHAVNKGDAQWVGLVVGLLAHGLAVASEEADKRSWRTLPDEIQISRLWVPAGEYESRIQTVGRAGGAARPNATRPLILRAGQTVFLIERVVL